jgi:ribosome-binding protein aMBF1 (putative translation factor)
MDIRKTDIRDLDLCPEADLTRRPMPKTFHGEAYALFIERLVAARIKAGITQTELAKRLGRHQSFVSNFETKIRRLDIVEAMIIVREIGLDPMEVVRDLSILIGPDISI